MMCMNGTPAARAAGSEGQKASSVVRGMPYHSSKPRSFGRRPGVLPRCHLPNAPVAYPEIERIWAIVTSHCVNPSSPPPIGTLSIRNGSKTARS